MARKSKYAEYVKPKLEQIKEWSAAGATEKEICLALGIAVSTFNEYKNQYSELTEALRAGRQSVVLDIKAALLKKALGFEYEEEKNIGKKDKDGESIVLVERYKRYSPPDTTAAAMLLRNYDKEWLDRDNASSTLRQQEYELKKAIAEASNFDLILKE